MDFRILGTLEVFDGDQAIALGGAKQRALLALLVLHANESLSTERLIDELWEESPPATAAKSVQVHVSRLRKALDEQSRNGSTGLVLTREHGYELRIDPDCVDAHRFERLLADGRRELAAGRTNEAVARLERALSLCRGPPLDDFSYSRFAQAEIARLDDLRVAVLEELIDAKLALGRHAEVVEELRALVDAHPYRERLRGQLMLALYRCDRQADALECYQQARRVLVEELGIEPSSRLRELEESVLRQDPALALPVEHQRVPNGAPDSAPAHAPEPVAVGPTGSRDSSRTRQFALALVVTSALVAGGAALVLDRGERGSPSRGPALDSSKYSLAALDGSHRRAAFAVPLPGRPTSVAVAGGAAWITTVDSAAVTSVDARQRAITRTVPLRGRPDAVAVANGSVWVADGERATVSRLRPGYEDVVQRISYPRPRLTPAPRASIAAGAGAVWVANGVDRLVRIDPGSGRVTPVDVGRAIDGVAVSGGAVWAISSTTASVLRVDPRTDVVTDRIQISAQRRRLSAAPIGIAATPRTVWVLNGNAGTVTRIDPSSIGVAATVDIGVERVPSAIAAGGRFAWVANGDGTLSRIDESNGVRTARVGGSLERVATDGARVWVTTAALEQRLPGGVK